MLELNRAYTERTYTCGFCFSDDLYQIAAPDSGARLLFAKVDSGKPKSDYGHD